MADAAAGGKRKRTDDTTAADDADAKSAAVEAQDDDDDEADVAQQRQDDEEDDEIQRRLNARSAENERLSELYEQFMRVATPEQIERFEHWKRSSFPRAAMKRLMKDIVGVQSDRGAMVLATLAKMFVGELVSGAREQMTAAGETGPIQPSHLRQAHRRAQRAGTVPPSTRQSTRLFWRPDSGA